MQHQKFTTNHLKTSKQSNSMQPVRNFRALHNGTQTYNMTRTHIQNDNRGLNSIQQTPNKDHMNNSHHSLSLLDRLHGTWGSSLKRIGLPLDYPGLLALCQTYLRNRTYKKPTKVSKITLYEPFTPPYISLLPVTYM